jgi:hypothetical protein
MSHSSVRKFAALCGGDMKRESIIQRSLREAANLQNEFFKNIDDPAESYMPK